MSNFCRLFLVFLVSIVQKGATIQPNIFLFMFDDIGFFDRPWNSDSRVKAPTMKGLAEEGVILDWHYVEPACSPSRAALLTGIDACQIGRQLEPIPRSVPTSIDPSVTLLPQYLKDAGYSTYMVGKWHLGFCKWEYTPTYRGFDNFTGMYTGSADYVTHRRQHGASYFPYDFREDERVYWGAEGTHATEVYTNRMITYIEEHDTTKPAFFYASMQSIHIPLEPPQEYLNQFPKITSEKRQDVLAQLKYLDDSIEAIIDAAKQHGMYNNSIFVFTSDNGGGVTGGGPNGGGPLGGGSYNYPLRGKKGSLFEGGCRVFAFIHAPNLITQYGTLNKPIHITDWVPTLVAQANGGTVPSYVTSTGMNQWDCLTNLQDQENQCHRTETIYTMFNWTEDGRYAAIRQGDYKLIVGQPEDENENYFIPPDPEKKVLSGLPTNPSTGTTNFPYNGTEYKVRLFNLAVDENETNDLAQDPAGTHNSTIRDLLERLETIGNTVYTPADMPTSTTAGHPSQFSDTYSPGWC